MTGPGNSNPNLPGQQTPPPLQTDDDALRTRPYESAGGEADAPAEFAPGTLLQDRYLLERLLGHGGMGQVYLARDLTLDRAVAVKLIRPRDPHLRNRTVCEAEMRKAFVAEARIGAGLTHPAIATVYDFGFHGDEPFIVFEYIDGLTLRALLTQRGRLPLEEARLVLGPLAQALDFAHARQVVHRDLKPENLRATAQGHFKILDLGLAQEFRRETDWRFAGTPAYCAPEQAACQPCDGRTDQYSLALIAQELLTGRRVFRHENLFKLLEMQRGQAPPSPQAFVPDLPDAVCAALARALHKEPNQRFASCEEFAAGLGCQFLSVPVEAPEILHLTAALDMQDTGAGRSVLNILMLWESSVYLALTSDSLWVVYRGEINRWPFGSIREVGRNRRGNQLQLRIFDTGKFARQWFEFGSRNECQQWHDRLLAFRADSTLGRADGVLQQVRPVVLMRRRPEVRHQVLGVVEYNAAMPRRARAGLRLRAAMMGADAIVDVQEERLPEFKQTVRRASGTAIRAVDHAGRLEIRSRWFAEEASRVSLWMLLLVGISAAFTLIAPMSQTVPGVFEGGASRLQLYMALAPREWSIDRLATTAGLLCLIYAWPLTITLLARLSLWPQLLWPAALAALALAVREWVALLAIVITSVRIGKWDAIPGLSTISFNVNLGLLVYGCVVYRWTVSAYAEYRALIPADELRPPFVRRSVSRMAAWISIAFALVLVVATACAAYQYVAEFGVRRHDTAKLARPTPPPSLPGDKDRAERAARASKLLDEGLAQLPQQPAKAELAFRRALREWGLLRMPGRRPEDRHNLALTHQNIGAALTLQGKYIDAGGAFLAALATYDELEATALAYQNHKPDRAKVELALTELRRTQPVWEDAEEQREAQRLTLAGRHREAVAVCRKFLERHEQRAEEFSDQPLFTQLLAAKQNRLAWLLAVSPDLQLRDSARAITLAKNAVTHSPKTHAHWTMLGAAYYRAGNWEECRAALERSTQLRGGGDGYDWFFLAMTCQRLGRPDEAKQWLDRAVRWAEQPPSPATDNPLLLQQREVHRREVDLLRREAEELILGKASKPDR